MRETLKIDQNAAHQLLNSARTKLGITPMQSIRDAGKQLLKEEKERGLKTWADEHAPREVASGGDDHPRDENGRFTSK